MISPYLVKFEHLSLGEHDFEFEADQSLFEGNGNEDIHKASFKIYMKMYKTGNMMDLNFRYEGRIELPCDRCDEQMKVEIDGESKLIVKFGQTDHIDLDDMLVLEDHEREINLGQYIYESLSLLIPFRKVHDEKDCNPEVLKRLKKVEEERSSGQIDPRWEKLKNI